MKKLFPIIFFVIFSHITYGQCSTDSLNISTGYNPLTGTLTTPTTLDAKWTSTVSAAAATAIAADGYTIGCYDIVPLGLWNPSGPNCHWISGQNYWGYHTSGTGGDIFTMTLSRSFQTCTSDSLRININVQSDDGITNMYFDGNPIYTVPFVCGATGYANRVFNLGMVAAGNHTFSIVIHNCNNGYYVNAIGMALNGRIFSTTGHSPLKKEDGTVCAPISSAADSSLCGGATVLHSDTSGTGYLWNTGDTSSSISAASTGSYWVSYTLPSCSMRIDTFHLNPAIASASHYSHDTTLCATSVTLAVPGGYTSYNWSNGSTASSINVTASGIYTVSASNGCSGSRVDTFHVFLYPPLSVNLGHDTAICTGNQVILSSVQPTGTYYLWSTGDVTNTIYVTSSGTYWLNVSNGACSARDSIVVTVHNTPIVALGNDTTLCSGTSIILYSPQPTGYLYTWNTGSTGSAIVVNTSGTYRLQVNNNGCVDRDTINVTFTPKPVVNLGPDTTVCTATTFSLFSSQPAGYTYMWSTGSTTPGITVTSSGFYWLSVANSVCVTKDTVHIIIGTVSISLGPDSTFCIDGNDFTLYSPQPTGTSYYWSTGSVTDTIHVATAGTYWLSVNNSGCVATDTIKLNIGHTPSAAAYIKENICVGDTTSLALIIRSANANDFTWNFDGANIITHNSNHGGPYKVSWNTPGIYVISVTPSAADGCIGATYLDTVYVHEVPKAIIDISTQTTVRCYSDSVWLRAMDADNSSDYKWTPTHFFSGVAGPDQWARIGTSGYVTLTVTTPFGCKAEDSVLFTPECCELYFPTAFTPNGDGHNDVFRPIGEGYHKFHDLRIDNRWGQTVFESTSSDMSWDGTFNGVKQDLGTFYYYVKYDCNGKTKFQKGDVTLIR